MNRRSSILLVDDDEDDKLIFLEALKRTGGDFDFRWIRGGREALKILTGKESALPDYLFLDLNMPMIDGNQLLRELRKTAALPATRITVYSTSPPGRDAPGLRDLEVFCYLIKPPNINSLCAAIRFIMEPLPENYIAGLEKYLSLL
jgi:CheY-like chemotaxis protein